MQGANQLYAQYGQPLEKRVTFSATNLTYQMTIKDRVLVVNSAASVGTVTLPPVSECALMTFVIRDDGSYVSAVLIQDKNDSTDWTDDSTAAAKDSIVVMSDGQKWHVLLNELT